MPGRSEVLPVEKHPGCERVSPLQDPMFTEDIVQYQLEHPIPPEVLQRFPGYENFPLLLSRIDRPKLEPNITDQSKVKHLRGHNEAMLENYREPPCNAPRSSACYLLCCDNSQHRLGLFAVTQL